MGLRDRIFRIGIGLAALAFSLRYGRILLRKGTTDHEAFRSIFIKRELRLPDAVRPKLIIDAGAYTGLSAIYFAARYPDAMIIAVEPEESNFRMLELNTRKLRNVRRVRAGLWHRKGFLKVVDTGTGKDGFAVEEAASGIRAVTVGMLLKESGHDRIGILKIDIEGSEKEVFSSAGKWIGKTDAIIAELHDRLRKGCSSALYSCIELGEWRVSGSGEKAILIRKS